LPLVETSRGANSLLCTLDLQGLETKQSLFSEFFLSHSANIEIFFFPTTGCFLMLLLMIVFIFGVFFYGFESAVLKEEGLTIWFWEQSASKRHGWFAHHFRPG